LKTSPVFGRIPRKKKKKGSDGKKTGGEKKKGFTNGSDLFSFLIWMKKESMIGFVRLEVKLGLGTTRADRGMRALLFIS